MLDFSDKPYQFFPPKPRRLVLSLAKRLNRRWVLPGKKHRIKEIELQGADHVLPILKQTRRCLLLPNHSTHSDPQLMLEVQRRMLIDASTMAAYDVFLRGKFNAWFMQSIGCFSVDREGSDKLAMNCAVDTLIEGKRGLTIFPEGNVLLMNDRIAPFLSGAAFIGMRAQKKLGKDQPIYAIPISMKFSHLTDCEPSIHEHLEQLENTLGISSPSKTTLRQRMRNVGLQVLSRNLKQRGFMQPPEDDEDLSRVLQSCAVDIVEKLEQKIEIEAKSDQSPLDRIRRIRSTIHQTRIDPERQIDHRVAATWADEAILAIRILSYSADYLASSPTLDRHGETLEKLREDLAEKILHPIGDRKAFVRFGQPINLVEHLDAGSSRKVVADLTQTFESAVQSGIDAINASNNLPGSQPLETLA